MRMRNKYRKPTTLRCDAGNRFSLSLSIWIVVGILLMLQLYSHIHRKNDEYIDIDIHANLDHRSFFCGPDDVADEEDLQIPPPRKRSPRATKRRPKRPTTIIDEFLDDASPLRHVFFPDRKNAIDPMKENGNDTFWYFPGRMWLDTDGNPIQAHGGCILYDGKSRIYYWYGENKDGPTFQAHKKGVAWVDIIGVGCYSSKNLWTWKFEGIVLPSEETDETHDLYKSNVLLSVNPLF